MHQLIKTDDGRRKFMCPADGTWAVITEAQYRGEAEMACPHPTCGWKGTVNLAAEEAEARAAAAPVASEEHF